MARAPQPPAVAASLPGAALGWVGRRLGREWRAGPIHRLALGRPRTDGLAIRPRDPRPADAEAGQRLLAGVFALGGETLEIGPGGDPWLQPAPSHRFAVALHRFDWAHDLLATGEPGARRLLRLWLEWRREFGVFNAFAWTGEALERRVFNLACAATDLAPLVSDAEGAAFVDGLARQARHLLGDPGDPGRAAERAAVAALAGAALAGKAGEALSARALARLERLAPEAVLRDGVHASRSPERGLELLFDLMALDDALSQRGAPPPPELSRAIDRLSGGVRLLTGPDGRLAAFHGGEASRAARVAAALALDSAAGAPARAAPYGGYQRLDGRALRLVVDAGGPPPGAFAGAACAQPGAIAVWCEGRRLIEASVWSARAQVGGALRGPAGGSCLALDELWPGATLRHGLLARDLGERLESAAIDAKADRRETEAATWLDLTHEGWRGVGFTAVRRIYLDTAADEVRGEDVLTPAGGARRSLGYAIRFHLAAGVAAQLARDGASALLRPAGGHGWRLRGDAGGLRLDADVAFDAGEPRATQVLSLVGRVSPREGLRVRWKLSRDDG
jgi:uncharacterized heparinase superfamily protein